MIINTSKIELKLLEVVLKAGFNDNFHVAIKLTKPLDDIKKPFNKFFDNNWYITNKYMKYTNYLYSEVPKDTILNLLKEEWVERVSFQPRAKAQEGKQLEEMLKNG